MSWIAASLWGVYTCALDRSTGCGDNGCLLCQYNPSRLCKRNIKSKYLIDDPLKAKCNAALRVELVDEANNCVAEGLPAGMQLECLVMNGEKYKEICPDNTLLSHAQLRTCIISHHTRALLRREGGSDDQLRCFLQLEVCQRRARCARCNALSIHVRHRSLGFLSAFHARVTIQ